jgi:type II secretory pathway component PulF
MAVGERTGNIDLMFTPIARYCEEECSVVVDGRSKVIEPLIIVFSWLDNRGVGSGAISDDPLG